MTQEEHIHPVVVPKWGLTMEHGVLVAWNVSEGSQVAAGDELLEIETSKITNTVEAPQGGVLRRQVGRVGQNYACGALIGVIAAGTVPEDEITAFVLKHAHVEPEALPESGGPRPAVLEVCGHALRYLARGAGGVPILFIHGLGGDLNNWMFVQPPLSESRATYAVDLPGHGSSSKDLTSLESLDDLAAVLVAFLDRLMIDRVHMVAHSMGAAIALAIGRQWPHRVVSLTLLGPAGLGVPLSPQFVRTLIAAATRREVSALLGMLVADERIVTRQMGVDLLRYKRLDGVSNALNRFAGLLAAEDRPPSQAITGITAPIYLIWGAQDRIISPVPAAMLPDSIVFSVLEGAGHLPHIEKSSQVIELIRNAVER